MRRLGITIGLCTLAFAVAAAADKPDDQPELKSLKKETPKAKDNPAAKDDPAKKPGEELEPLKPLKKDGEVPKEDTKTQEILARLAKNLEASGERLKQDDPGNTTRRIQGDIIKDLDELIKQQQNSQSKSQSQQSQSSKSSKSSRSKGGGTGQSGGNPSGQQTPGGQKTGSGRQTSGSQDKKSGNPDKKGGEQDKKGGNPDKKGGEQGKKGGEQGKKDQTAGGQKKDGQGKDNKGGTTPKGTGVGKDTKTAGTAADLSMYKEVWGHLSDAKRLEMDAYSRERFMPRYDDLLKQYYRTIAEQNRRKGD